MAAHDAPGRPHTGAATNEADTTLQIPVAGYPISEDAVADWFQRTYQRPPTDRELGAIIDAMAQREATPPHVGPNSEPEGWTLGPVTSAIDRG